MVQSSVCREKLEHCKVERVLGEHQPSGKAKILSRLISGVGSTS